MSFDSRLYSFSEIVNNIGGKDFKSVSGVKFKPQRTLEHVIAGGDDAQAIKAGPRTYSGELIVLQSGFEELMQAAKDAGGKDVTDITFTMVVNFSNDLHISTYTLSGCRISDAELGGKTGDAKIEITMPFLFLDLDFQY